MNQILIKQGEDYTKVLEITYADTGDPVNFSGISAYSQMRDKPNGVLIATGICTVDDVNHTVTVVYPSSVTSEIVPGEYGYDIWLMDEYNRKHPVYTTRCSVVGRYTNNFGGE